MGGKRTAEGTRVKGSCQHGYSGNATDEPLLGRCKLHWISGITWNPRHYKRIIFSSSTLVLVCYDILGDAGLVNDKTPVGYRFGSFNFEIFLHLVD